MIPWFFNRDEVKKFLAKNKNQKSLSIKNLGQEIHRLRRTLDERIRAASHESKSANRQLTKKKIEASKEALRLCSIHVASTQPTMNAYVAKKLEFGLFEAMSIEGFLMPQELQGLKDNIDFGLYSSDSMDELERIIRHESDPFADIGINISDEPDFSSM